MICYVWSVLMTYLICNGNISRHHFKTVVFLYHFLPLSLLHLATKTTRVYCYNTIYLSDPLGSSALSLPHFTQKEMKVNQVYVYEVLYTNILYGVDFGPVLYSNPRHAELSPADILSITKFVITIEKVFSFYECTQMAV